MVKGTAQIQAPLVSYFLFLQRHETLNTVTKQQFQIAVSIPAISNVRFFKKCFFLVFFCPPFNCGTIDRCFGW